MQNPKTSKIQTDNKCSLKELVERYLRDFVTEHQGCLPEGEFHELVLQQVEKPLIDICLEICNDNQTRAAQLLGMNRNTLKKKIKLYENFCAKID